MFSWYPQSVESLPPNLVRFVTITMNRIGVSPCGFWFRARLPDRLDRLNPGSTYSRMSAIEIDRYISFFGSHLLSAGRLDFIRESIPQLYLPGYDAKQRPQYTNIWRGTEKPLGYRTPRSAKLASRRDERRK